MYYVGLFPKFKVNRLLVPEERKMRLRQDVKLFLEPTSALSVIRINSTYLEIADKFYPWKGSVTAIMLICALVAISMPVGLIFFVEGPVAWQDMSPSQKREEVLFILAITAMVLPILAFLTWLILKEAFRYTHYPIRLSRKNRKVYVFRLDGTVLEVPWDDLFITMGPATPSRAFGVEAWDLRAHVLDQDGETVRETFAFGYVSDPENLRHYFAYLQRYMDEGPQAVAPYTLDCLDIVDRRETAVFGFKRLWVNPNGLLFIQALMLPLFIVSAIGRVIAMRTSKIPQWPSEVEAANRIEPGEPWVRDARTHPAR